MKSACSVPLLLAMLSIVSAGTTSFTFHAGKECQGEVIGQKRIVPLDDLAYFAGKAPICASKEGQTIESVHINSLLDGGHTGDLYCVDVYETSDCSGDATFAQQYNSGDDTFFFGDIHNWDIGGSHNSASVSKGSCMYMNYNRPRPPPDQAWQEVTEE